MGKLVYKGEQGRHLSDDMGQRLGWNEGSNYVTGPLLIGCLVVRCTLLLLSHASSYGHWIIYTSWLSIPARFQNPGGKCLYLFHVSLNSLNWAHGSHDLVPPRCFLVRPADQLVIRGALKRANGMPSGWQGVGSLVKVPTEQTWWPELDLLNTCKGRKREQILPCCPLGSTFTSCHHHPQPIIYIYTKNQF